MAGTDAGQDATTRHKFEILQDSIEAALPALGVNGFDSCKGACNTAPRIRDRTLRHRPTGIAVLGLPDMVRDVHRPFNFLVGTADFRTPLRYRQGSHHTLN